MFTPQRKAPFLTAVLFGLFAFMAVAPAGRANSSYTYNLDCTTASSCLTSHSYGTVTVSSTTTANQVDVMVQLTGGNDFETGANPTFAFNVKNAVVTNSEISLLTNGFVTIGTSTSTGGATINSPSFGTFTNGIECNSGSPGACGGTSNASVSFLVTATTGTLTVADFAPNANGFAFAADVGPSGGSTSSYIAAVPEPQWYGALMLAGLVALKVTRNRSLKTNQVQA